MKNKVMLVTYPDSLGGNLKALSSVLSTEFRGLFENLHILPFFPSSGDRGFAPLCYDEVNPRFGSWQDVEELGRKYDIMCDFMINHISRQSKYLIDYAENGRLSKYRDMFIRWDEFWPNGEPTAEELKSLYRRRPQLPYTEVEVKGIGVERLWSTFSSEQIDINQSSEAGKAFIKDSLGSFAQHNISCVRLDAFAAATKRPGTSCFFVEPDIWILFDEVKKILEVHNVDFLPEIHNSYVIQKKLSEHGFYIYDFALPMLVLHALYSKDVSHLVDWLAKSPMKQFTTLDTHDGIGIVDVKGILSDNEISFTKDCIFTKGVNTNPEYNTLTYGNLDIYQVNSTYYSALGEQPDAYIIARAIQIFAPGIPQIYYVGLLAGSNDIVQLEATKEGRSINRHNYTREEIKEAIAVPVVQELFSLINFRNTCEAFSLEGSIKVYSPKEHCILIERFFNGTRAVLEADLETLWYRITENGITVLETQQKS